jgi:hypothetical protein
MRIEAEGERNLSLLTLPAFKSGTGAGAEVAYRLRLFRTGKRDKADGEGMVEVTAGGVTTETWRYTTVAL